MELVLAERHRLWGGESRFNGPVRQTVGEGAGACDHGAVPAAFRRCGACAPVLARGGLLGAVFSDIPSEPTDRHVGEALDLFRRERCGTIVACGGGGPIDVAKAVSLLDANGGTIRDYAGVGRVPHPGVPIIAIPTTAGSGSEVSGTTIITEEATHEKLLVISMYLVPEIAILDPLLTYGMPPALTAATGVDALIPCH